MKTLLIIPMYNTVLLPDVDYRLSVDSISDVEKDRIETDQGKAVFLPLKTEKNRKEMEPVAPTAASAPAPSIRPTIMESARL